MPTIVDALVAQLTLDATPYKRQWKDVEDLNAQGQKKRETVNKKNDAEQRERERRTKQAAQDQKKLFDATTGSIATLGRTLIGAFLGFETLSGGVKFLGELNASQAALGYNAERIGQSVESLNIYGKAVELAGGKATDATQAFAQLSGEIATKRTKGNIGPLLQLLNMKGVAWEDNKGKLRDFGAVLDDLGKKTEGMDKFVRAKMFQDAGLPEGVINRLLEAQDIRDKDLQTAKEWNASTKASTDAAKDLKKGWDEVGQAVDNVGNQILQKVTPATKDALHAVTLLAKGDLVGANQAAGNSILGIGDLYAQWGEKIAKKAWDLNVRAGDALISAFTSTEDQAGLSVADAFTRVKALKPNAHSSRNNNPGNVKAVGSQAHDAQGFRIFATMEEGIQAMMDNVARKFAKGDNTITKLINAYEGTDATKDPYATAAYIARVEKTTGRDRNATFTEADLPAIMSAMVAQEAGVTDAQLAKTPAGATPSVTTKAGAEPSPAAPGAPGSTTAAAPTGNTTTVTITEMNVHSASADPAAVAEQVPAAITRKLTVAQANTGAT
jgi:hypothetical protein